MRNIAHETHAIGDAKFCGQRAVIGFARALTRQASTWRRVASGSAAMSKRLTLTGYQRADAQDQADRRCRALPFPPHGRADTKRD